MKTSGRLLIVRRVVRSLVVLCEKYCFSRKAFIVHEKIIGSGPVSIEVKTALQFSRLEKLDSSSFELLRSCNPYLRQQEYRANAQKGHDCFIGTEGNQVLFMVWVRRLSITSYQGKLLEGYPVVSPDEVHFFGAYTKKEFRGRKIYPSAILYLEEYYGKRGFTRITCTTSRNRLRPNASQRGIAKIGMLASGKEIVKITIFRHSIYKRNFNVSGGTSFR